MHNLSLYCDNRSKTPVDYKPGMSYRDRQGQEPIELEDGTHWSGEFPLEFIRSTEKEAIISAKADGWIFKRDGRTFCPRCKKFIK